MRVVVQRVKSASVAVDSNMIGQIGNGLLLYVGLEKGDGDREIAFMAKKVLNLRIFSDKNNLMNLSLLEKGGDLLSISQFTLASYIKKGRRPDFTNALEPVLAREFYEKFNGLLRNNNVKVETGLFGAMMEVESINDGPVTFIIEKKFY